MVELGSAQRLSSTWTDSDLSLLLRPTRRPCSCVGRFVGSLVLLVADPAWSCSHRPTNMCLYVHFPTFYSIVRPAQPFSERARRVKPEMPTVTTLQACSGVGPRPLADTVACNPAAASGRCGGQSSHVVPGGLETEPVTHQLHLRRFCGALV